MKTIKTLAEELKISKQKLYRYIKDKHINDVVVIDGKFLVNDSLEKTLKKTFKELMASNNRNEKPHQTSASKQHHKSNQNSAFDTDMIRFLKDELKRAHDRNDHLQKMLENQQILMLRDKEIIESLESKSDDSPSKKWWNFKKRR